MSFSIYAHGLQFKTGNTGSTKRKVLANENKVILGVEWQSKVLISTLSLLGYSSNTGKGSVAVTRKMGMMQASRIISQQIQIIAMNSNRGGKISLHTKKNNLLIDDEDYKTFHFSPKEPSSFVRNLLRHLETVGFNRLGVLSQIIKALAELSSLGCNGYFIVNMEIKA